MGLKGVFQSAAKVAMSVAGDIKRACTYTQVVDDGINDVSTTSWPLIVLFGEFSRKERNENENIQPGDVLGVVIYGDMLNRPVRGDKVVEDLAGIEYRVIDSTADPAQATYEIHLRTL